MPPQHSGQSRDEIIRRLELECRQAEAKLRRASDAHSLARADKRNAEARLLRAKSPPDGGRYCLMCWVNDQRLSYLRRVAGAEPGPTERWRCEDPGCGHEEERATGSAA
jgi:hypothetical protein